MLIDIRRDLHGDDGRSEWVDKSRALIPFSQTALEAVRNFLDRKTECGSKLPELCSVDLGTGDISNAQFLFWTSLGLLTPGNVTIPISMAYERNNLENLTLLTENFSRLFDTLRDFAVENRHKPVGKLYPEEIELLQTAPNLLSAVSWVLNATQGFKTIELARMRLAKERFLDAGDTKSADKVDYVTEVISANVTGLRRAVEALLEMRVEFAAINTILAKEHSLERAKLPILSAEDAEHHLAEVSASDRDAFLKNVFEKVHSGILRGFITPEEDKRYAAFFGRNDRNAYATALATLRAGLIHCDRLRTESP